ncbi:MAG: LysR substrate-binding domain-containing protein, partial [Sulfitobacter sp.]
LGLTGPLARSIAGAWMDANVPVDQITIAADSFLTLQEMAAVGRGIAVLPCFVGDRDDRLRKLPHTMPPMKVPLWVAQHVDAIETQQMRAVKMRLIRFLVEQRDLVG